MTEGGYPPFRFRRKRAMFSSLESVYEPNMENTSNPFVQTLLQKGYTVAECRTPAPKQKFPLTVYGSTYQTEAAYNEAIADFLNGN